jgi:creatinine amidohydrolase
MKRRFSQFRYPEVKAAADAGAVLVLPLGQTEEHGPHLPINTDTYIGVRVCEEAIERLNGEPPAFLLDEVAYGFSQKVMKEWPGTFVVPQDILIQTLKHIMISVADMGFRKVVVVSTHGNHDGVARVAARSVTDERGIGPGVFFPFAAVGDVLKQHGKAGPGGVCHACEMETSLMLYLRPEWVDMTVAVATDKLQQTSPYPSSQAYVSTWTMQKSRSGTYGDPTVATPELGQRLFEKAVAETAGFIRYYHGLKQV